MKPVVAFITGPYRAKSSWQMERNIRNAERVAIELWAYRIAAITPHKNTARLGGSVPEEYFLEGYLQILSRCSVVVLVGGWENSAGSLAEIAEARQLGIPIYEKTIDLIADLSKGRRMETPKGLQDRIARAQENTGLYATGNTL